MTSPAHALSPAPAGERLHSRRNLWTGIGVGMLVVIALIATWTLRVVNNQDKWVIHAREVIMRANELFSDLREAESFERGYILTGQAGYLDDYRASVSRIPESLAKLKGLTLDNSHQQQRLAELQQLVQIWLDHLATGVRLRQDSGFAAAQQFVAEGRDRDVMVRIRDLSRRVSAEEYQLLQERSELRRRRMQQGFAATLFAAGLGIAILLWAGFDLRRVSQELDATARESRESSSMTRALFEAAAQGIFVADSSGHILMVNPAMEKIFGYTRDELLSLQVETLVSPHLREKHVGLRAHYFRHPQNRPMGMGLDLQAERKDGTEFYAEISLSHIETAGGTRAVVFITDISKRRADEQAIRQQSEDLRVLAGKLMTAQDDERRRIARDLHDDLSQQLAYLAIDLGKSVNKRLPEEMASQLRNLQRRTVEAAEAVRKISHQLHPSVLDDIGLTAALEQYCEEFEERTGIAAEFVSRNVPEALDPKVAASVYHIGQECLRNVAKHAKSDAVMVTLEMKGRVLRLNVRDHGIGLSPQAGQSGIGLVAMKERAYLVNGKVVIQSQAGEGTEVVVEVPVTV